MVKLILPNHRISELEGSLVYLAGPINGAPRWRDKVIKYFFGFEGDLGGEIVAISPERRLDDSLNGYVLKNGGRLFIRQWEWERFYAKKILGSKGVVMFWFPGSAENVDNYGEKAKEEFGVWIQRYLSQRAFELCVGSDGNFPGWEVIRHYLAVHAPEVSPKTTLIDTCKEALRVWGFR